MEEIKKLIDFNKLIDNHLAREYTPKLIDRYYPSEIGRCIRKTWKEECENDK